MTSYAEVFQRIEKKYRVNTWQRAFVEGALGAHMAPDVYGLARVTSVYWDTPMRSLIARSLEKPLYKEKLRVRAYGLRGGEALVAAFAGGETCDAGSACGAGWECDAGSKTCGATCEADGAREVAALEVDIARQGRGAGSEARAGSVCGDDAGAACDVGDVGACGAGQARDLVFVELKKKYDGVVYKRRVGMSLAAAGAFLAGDDYLRACGRFPIGDAVLDAASRTAESVQIAHEIEAMRKRHGGAAVLAPAMAIACDRVAWAPQEQCADELGELRVTFDGLLRFKECGVPRWQPIIGEDESIMEIKSAGPLPLWLSAALAEARVYPTSFSKYGTAAQIAAARGHARPGRVLRDVPRVAQIATAQERVAAQGHATAWGHVAARESARALHATMKGEYCA